MVHGEARVEGHDVQFVPDEGEVPRGIAAQVDVVRPFD
jgi:hypothetical protein